MSEKKEMEFIDGVVVEGAGISAEGLSDEEKQNLENDGHVEFENPEKGEKKDSKQEKEKKASPEDTGSKKDLDPETIKKDLELTEKRRKDTEKAFQKEHQEKLRLEAELEALKKNPPADKGKKSDPEDDDFLFGDDEVVDEGTPEDKKPEAGKDLEAIKADLDAVKQKQIADEQQRALDVWEQEAVKVKAEHDDFDEVVYDIFEIAFTASPAVKEEFISKGSTPQAAYELGSRLKAYEEAVSGKDPKKLDTENAEEKKSGDIDPEQALGGNSASNSSAENINNDPGSLIDEALAGIT